MVKPQAAISGNRGRGARVYTVDIYYEDSGSFVRSVPGTALSFRSPRPAIYHPDIGRRRLRRLRGRRRRPGGVAVELSQCRGAGFQGKHLYRRHGESTHPHDLRRHDQYDRRQRHGGLSRGRCRSHRRRVEFTKRPGVRCLRQPLYRRYEEQRDPQGHQRHHLHRGRRQHTDSRLWGRRGRGQRWRF